MKKWIAVIVLILCPLLIVGCATVGREMHLSEVNQIQKGITTKDEIIKVFGQPDTTYFGADGKLVFSYFASKCQNTIYNFIPIVNIVHSEMKMKNQMLVIVFSKDGVVEEYSFTNSDKPLKYGIVP